MRAYIAALVCVLLGAAVVSAQEQNVRRKPAAARQARQKPEPVLECGNPLAFQVLLDRRGFSPGAIDGTIGPNVTRALNAFQSANNIGASGAPDCATWNALGGDGTEATTTYQVTEADNAGSFEPKIPSDLVEQAKLPALSYRSLTERLAERFHAAPALLAKLNPGVTISSGASIQVPNVTPFDDNIKPASVLPTKQGRGQPPPEPSAQQEYTVEVSRENWLRVLRADGGVEFFAPVTSGSEHDPLPPGQWHVTGIHWMPVFNYNPALFWDAKPDQTRAAIKPGPNNPVGVVWIDINVEHYGLHGTPEPSAIGHTQSHGCVRLTNWDAARVATLVKVGTPIIFK